MQALRYWDYYNMTGTFTELYDKAKHNGTFSRLYDIIISRENILLAFRKIKSNRGSHTAGTDGKTIQDIKKNTEEELITLIRQQLENYRPKKVRRVLIPKLNGKLRPIGIACILDRIIQQCFKQVLEPIAEAHFFTHSYGFRPLRSAHHAMARVQHLVNQGKLNYVVDIDIQSFFDTVNHTLLMKQLWNMGIRDRKVLRIIGKMLKAPVEGAGIPTKGVQQGGTLSPLLSNIVLHDLDRWVAEQWEDFPTHYPYSRKDSKYLAFKKAKCKLKEGYMVRYADDFKILCRDRKTAEKWFHAVRLYLKERLKLDISPEKSQIVNLKKHPSEFLGFTIRAVKKGETTVAQTGISDKKKVQIVQTAKARILAIQKAPTTQNALLFNSFVLGIHNYFSRATRSYKEFSRLAYDLRAFTYNRLRKRGKHEHPVSPPPTYKKLYNTNFRTYKICGVYLFPLADAKIVKTLNFSAKRNPFTAEGRELLHKSLKPDVHAEIILLMKTRISDRSVEFMDNRISRYSMQQGKCEITGRFLYANEVACHHVIPLCRGGSDKFSNLRILHQDVLNLIHSADPKTIVVLRNALEITSEMVNTINQYRKMSNLELMI